MTKLFRRYWHGPTAAERRQIELARAEISLGEAISQREYWTAMEAMLARRVQRLKKECKE